MTVWILLASCAAVIPMIAAFGMRRRYVVVTVAGASMTPSLYPGDRVLMRRGRTGPFGVGAAVVLRPPPPGRRDYRERAGTSGAQSRWALKRLAAVPGDPVPAAVREATGRVSVVPPGMAVVLADNKFGTDSREWGFVPVTEIVGVVLLTLPRRGGTLT